ncbi:MAG: type II toxin-antitoxin system VapC family toxin [Akkermansiaceae bacterium]|nr:type II toxin-antitoxin system VapC family toxin [Akkermansiaceae bacterium]
MNFILDTCTFIWLTQEPSRLSKKARTIINDDENHLFLSDLSLWEITLKHTFGRFALPLPPEIWLNQKRDFHQLRALPIQSSSIFLTAQLPNDHLDPFDRLLAAQAIENHFTIISPDVPLSQLGADCVW